MDLNPTSAQPAVRRKKRKRAPLTLDDLQQHGFSEAEDLVGSTLYQREEEARKKRAQEKIEQEAAEKKAYQIRIQQNLFMLGDFTGSRMIQDDACVRAHARVYRRAWVRMCVCVCTA